MSSFYSFYLDKCAEKGVSPSAAAEAAGLTRSAYTGWGKGALPSNANINKLASFFDISDAEFHECDDIKARDIKQRIKTKLDAIVESSNSKKETATNGDGNQLNLSDMELLMLENFRKLSFEDRFYAIADIKARLHNQTSQDDQQESE